MNSTRFRSAVIGSLLLPALALTAAAAHADGLPVLAVNVGSSGVLTADGQRRLVTLDAGADTVVARIERRGGRVLAQRLLHGGYTIPAVAYDGSASGLSHDGRTLVLIRPRRTFPQARTSLLVLDTSELRPRLTIDLRGDYSFDAVSPDGATVYLVQYVAPPDPNRYAVRAYDVAHARLLPRPVVDPRERDEKMRGSPITRATSRDGRWAYTLYDGAGSTPFLHALDTSRRTARCISLPMLQGNRRLSLLRLHADAEGHRVSVVDGATALAAIDTVSFRAGVPTHGSSRHALLWALPAVVLLGVGALALALRVRRRSSTGRAAYSGT